MQLKEICNKESSYVYFENEGMSTNWEYREQNSM